MRPSTMLQDLCRMIPITSHEYGRLRGGVGPCLAHPAPWKRRTHVPCPFRAETFRRPPNKITCLHYILLGATNLYKLCHSGCSSYIIIPGWSCPGRALVSDGARGQDYTVGWEFPAE